MFPAPSHPSAEAAAVPRSQRVEAAQAITQVAALIFIVILGTTAILSAAGEIKLPYELHLLERRLPIVFRAHMAVSGLAAILIALALAARRHPAWHRPMGRLAAAAVLIGGLTALPSALLSEASPIARAAFFTQACVWLALLVVGLAAIRRQRFSLHRLAMLAMAAVASGAIWLRLATVATAVVGLPHDRCYAVAAWAAWLLPLLATAAFTINRRGTPWQSDRSPPRESAASSGLPTRSH